MKQTITTLFLLLFLVACAQEPPLTNDGVVTAVSTPTPTMTQTATAVSATTPQPTNTAVPTPTTVPTAMPETAVTRSPRTTPTPLPTELPTATPPPPLDVAALVEQLAFETVEGVNGRALIRLHVSEYGLRGPYYCEHGPYHWLDNNHLLLFPVIGYTNWFENPTVSKVTQPIVISLDGTAPWIIDISPTDRCDLPVWSAALQRVIEANGGQVRLRDLQGHITDTYNGQMPLFLASSGRRLLTGLTWIDLDTGESVALGNYGRVKFPQPVWTSDERRFFECCFGYGDILTGKYRGQEDYPGFWIGSAGAGPEYFGSGSRWVINDSHVMIELDKVSFFSETNQPVVPVIDPEQQTYVDVVKQLGLPDTLVDCGPFISPDGRVFWLSCFEWGEVGYIQRHDSSYLVMLPSFETITVPGKSEFRGWSADSRFLAYTELSDAETYTGTTWLMATGGNRQQIADEAAQLADWHDIEPLVALRFADKQRIQFVQTETGASRVIELDAPVINVVWQPVDGGVALVDENGRIWWLPDPFNSTVEPELLTPPMPDIHSVRWSPNGQQLAFVSETNLYIASLDGER